VITAEDTLLHDDTDDKTSAWPAVALAAFAILVGIFTLKFGLQTLTWIEARSTASSNPWLLEVPQPLPQTPAPTGKIEQIKLYNVEFNAPWPGKYKAESTLTHTTLHFDSGQTLVFYDPETQLDTLGTLKSSDPLNYQRFAAVFSGAPVNSNYDLFQQVYSAAPSSVSPLMNANDAQREHTLMMWKLAFGPDLDTGGGFHSFDWTTNRGFQFGDPAKGLPIAVRTFDDHNRQFRYIFIGGAASTASVTQEQIDSALRSLKPVPFEER
jgi:hypothetical protein